VALIVWAWSLSGLAQSKLEQGETVQETFELNALSLVVVGNPLSASGGPWRPVRGKYRWAMSYGEFYETVGRPDLAAQQTRRDVTSGILTWGGLAVGIGGGYLLIRGLGSEGFSTGAQVGLGLVIGGAASAVIGIFIDGAVISDREAGELADGYNHALLRRLQSPRSMAPRSRGSLDSRWRLTLAPALAPQVWGLSLAGRF
jgi:hypothetical protein